MARRRIIIGITGASGTLYGVRLLELLKPMDVETHLVLSRSAERVMAYETKMKIAEVKAMADVLHSNDDIGAPIASGSFPTGGMIIAPCSVRTMSEIATGVTPNLLSRAADVCLKEKRPLVLMVRETPLHLGHLRSMTALAEMGAFIAPPVPSFYAGSETIDQVVTQSAARALDHLGLDSDAVKRWGEDLKPARPK